MAGMATESSAGNVSETESDTSSVISDAMSSSFDVAAAGTKPNPVFRESLAKRVDSLVQENRVLKMEVETYKIRNRQLQEENRTLRQASVLIQAKAEQEEEYISNTLLKQIQELKKEKEALALTYEQEEECLTNDLSRKLVQLTSEKAELVTTLKQEQEVMVSRLLKKIKKLEADTLGKQQHLEQLRREKVELENTLEQEQEALVNRLWKRMDKLENEKRHLQGKLLEPVGSAPPSPMDTSGTGCVQASANGHGPPVQLSSVDSSTSTAAPAEPLPRTMSNDPAFLSRHIQHLRGEVTRLRQQLKTAQTENAEKMQQLAREEQNIRDENLRLQRRLQLEMERREQLCRNLSESESSLEMEDERHFNELQSLGGSYVGASLPPYRSRTISSPLTGSVSVPGGDLSSIAAVGRSISPAGAMGMAAIGLPNPPTPPPQRCVTCGSLLVSFGSTPMALATSSPAQTSVEIKRQSDTAGSKSSEDGENIFLRPSNPSTPKSSSMQTPDVEGGSPN